VRNRKIGFVFQQFNLLPRQTAQENVALPLIYLGGVPTAERMERAKQVLEQVGLGERLHHRPKELSGGQQQRVAIARALITRPALLLADEPTGNLDSRASIEIMSLFKELNQSGITVVLVTHEPDIAANAARVLTVRDGVLDSDTANRPQPLDGSPTSIWQRPTNGHASPAAPGRRRLSIARRPPLAAKRRNI
jgi:putative ABC transport system ATP-binding protein